MDTHFSYTYNDKNTNLCKEQEWIYIPSFGFISDVFNLIKQMRLNIKQQNYFIMKKSRSYWYKVFIYKYGN